MEEQVVATEDVVSVVVAIAQANATRLLRQTTMDAETAQDQDHQAATQLAPPLDTTNQRTTSKNLIRTAKETSSRHLQGIAINLCHATGTVAPVHPRSNSITVATKAINTLTTIVMNPPTTKSIPTESDTMVHSKTLILGETSRISTRLISRENRKKIITTI